MIVQWSSSLRFTVDDSQTVVQDRKSVTLLLGEGSEKLCLMKHAIHVTKLFNNIQSNLQLCMTTSCKQLVTSPE